MLNIAQTIEHNRTLCPDKTALFFEERSYSYADLDGMANRVANGLHRLGIGAGERVALLLPNIPEFIFAYLGIQKLGAIAVSISTMLKSAEVSYILNDCGALAVVTTAELRPNIVVGEVPSLRHVVIAEGQVASDIGLADMMAQSSAFARAREMTAHAPAVIVYTSGTTGFPKGATLSHGNVISTMYAKRHHCGTGPNDCLILFLPLFHCFGQNAILNQALHAGATIILQRRFDPEATLKAVHEHAVTMFFGVPTVYIRLLNSGASVESLRSVRYYFTAAAPMPVEVARKWSLKFGTPICEGYGLTETSPFASYNPVIDGKAGSIGKPIANVSMRVVDPDGNTLGPGERGELVVRGPNVMLGYWNRPVETAQAIKNGWFHTGDIGYADEEGFFYIVDRVKDMINIAGFKVYPSEVENVLYRHSAVAEVAVYGVPDAIQGESVAASIVLKAGQSASATEIMEYCRLHIANFKVPRTVTFVPALPKNPTGKILKRALQAEAQAA